MATENQKWLSRFLNITVALSFIEPYFYGPLDSCYTFDTPSESYDFMDTSLVNSNKMCSYNASMSFSHVDDAKLSDSVCKSCIKSQIEESSETAPSILISEDDGFRTFLEEFPHLSIGQSDNSATISPLDTGESRTDSSHLPDNSSNEDSSGNLDYACFQNNFPDISNSSLGNSICRKSMSKSDEKLLSKINLSERDLAVINSERFLKICSGLSSSEVVALKDIRRRSKNKLAARDCRKRRIEIYDELTKQVKKLEADNYYLSQKLEILKSHKRKILATA